MMLTQTFYSVVHSFDKQLLRLTTYKCPEARGRDEQTTR